PMNCPFHINVYSSKMRSYKQLPIRYAELGTVYRYERSGVLHGTLRVRGFTQDDAHVFCRPDQLEAEIVEILDFNMFFLNSFGFKEFEIFLSTQPEKFVGSEESWDLATNALANALKIREIEYEVDPGEGVFYGPKIDIKIRDVLKRSWQCTTIQVDFNNPERFDLHFVGEDGGRHRPIMIHRALLGSLERFFGILIEHYGGAFPVWLAPTQAIVIPITERHQEYAAQCLERISGSGIRAQLDDRNEKVGYKIREAETQKIPYMLIIGDKEVEQGMVSLRKRRKGDVGQIDLDNLISMIGEEVIQKSMET
ncbi:MAG: threonine--tRNA ligase, partial [bacterium]